MLSFLCFREQKLLHLHSSNEPLMMPDRQGRYLMQNWEEEPPYDWASEIQTACQCRNVWIFSLVPIIHLAKLLPKSWLLLFKKNFKIIFCLHQAACGTSLTKDQTIPPAVEARNLSHWATREVQDWLLLESASLPSVNQFFQLVLLCTFALLMPSSYSDPWWPHRPFSFQLQFCS